MISIAALSLTILSASAGSRPPSGAASAATEAQREGRASAAGGYVMAGGAVPAGIEMQVSRAGRWRVQGRVVSAGADIGGEPAPQRHMVDITVDGRIDFDDAMAVLQQWGAAGGMHNAVHSADIDADGAIDGCDLVAVLRAWSEVSAESHE